MSFVRRSPSSAPAAAAAAPSPIFKVGPNGTLLVSTGVAELDRLIGGGIGLGKVVVVIEDTQAPHHLVLLRYFMAQAVSHAQPLLFATALAAPHHFLSTLPALSAPNSEQPPGPGLRIAWQYHRYDGKQHKDKGGVPAADYVSSFDMRKSCTPTRVQCHSFLGARVDSFLSQCREFVSKLPPSGQVGRIAIHSMGAPQCMDLCSEWELLSSLLYLKALLHNTNAVAMLTVPATLLAASSTRWQHLADILLSLKAFPEEEQSKQTILERETLGLLHVHKLCAYNTQVPVVPETAAYAIKVVKKRDLVLEQLQLAPLAGAEGCHSASSSTDF